MTQPTLADSVVHPEDARFKVTEWLFADGAETGLHVHGHDYVIVPLDDGVFGAVRARHAVMVDAFPAGGLEVGPASCDGDTLLSEWCIVGTDTTGCRVDVLDATSSAMTQTTWR